MSSENRALGGLPSANAMLLARAPLELAVVEIRFLAPPANLSSELGLAIRDRLRQAGYDLPRLEPANEGRVSIQLTPGVLPVSQVEQVASGWQLISSDERTQLTVMPGAVVIQTSKYERWSATLRPLLEVLLHAAAELMEPSLVSRIGLRYINRISDPEVADAQGWRGRLQDALLGPVCHPVFGDRVHTAQQQVELKLGSSGQGALLRHGPFVDPAVSSAVSYLLDIDVFDSETRPFQSEELVNRAESLNRTAASLFKNSFTSAYFTELRGAAAEHDLAPEGGDPAGTGEAADETRPEVHP